MDPQPHPQPQPPATAPKLRLMCSYGGQIIPNPHTKSLCYSGGDTRLITIPTGTSSATSTNITSNGLTLPSLITHISSTLKITAPITLKYQLPHHNLDSLISLASDEDVLIMLDEHENNRTPSRLRLFVFPTKPFLSQPELKSSTQLNHPKTETWFVDALKNAKILNLEGNGNNGSGFCGAESMVLETSSSFGSTSSSVSLSNLGVKGGFVEDNGTGLVDNKVQLSTPEGISSDYGLGTAVCQDPQFVTYQDPAGAVSSVESKVSLINPFESERKIPNPHPLIGVEMHKTVPFSGYPVSLQYDQPQQLQFVQTAAPQYVPQNTTGIVPLSSYYVMSSPVPQQQVYYQSNQPQPIYLVPVAQPYNLPMQNGLMNTATVDSSRPPIHPDSSMYPAQMAYNVAASLPVAELASQVHKTIPRTSSPVAVPHVENQQQGGGPPQMNHQGQPTCAASMETGNFSKQIDDDPVHAQIYKSQPPPPTLPSQYKTMTPATKILLSEARTQLNTDNIKQQQPRTSQPQ
ncbi:hypothetical protein SADUNF_Sadunf17G0110900 [Salix dunnii]|uniref:PB1 domain-containing protein n=1 Tax=Salix dunnii TaxID=1413687 RepID=A0A835J922_9ROSI|nr:hypothetical protein SADUNF_Sadunf17G0110900 [Salix dunnii]